MENSLFVAVHIKTTKTQNGNSREGWLVYALPRDVGTQKCMGWVDRYYNTSDLQKEYPGAKVLCSLHVSPMEFNRARTDA